MYTNLITQTSKCILFIQISYNRYMDKKEVFEKIKEIIFSCPELTYYDLTVEKKS